MGVKKNMLTNLLLTSASVVFPLFTFPYVTRTLSSQGIGKFFFIDALTQYFIILSAVGIPVYGIREIAKIKNEPQERSKLVIELLLIQFFLAALSSVLLLISHYFIPDLKNEMGLVSLGCLAILSSAILMEWFYQGIESYTYITTRSLIIKTISVIAIFLLVKTTGDYLIYYLVTTVVITANALLNFSNYLKNYHVKSSVIVRIKHHIKPLLILSSISISVSVYAVLDTIILGLLTNPENVSYYNVPLKLVKIYWTVVNAAGMVLIPRITDYFASNNMADIQVIMQKSISIVCLLSIPFCFFCLILPHEILFVLSGNRYVYAANALRILSFVPFIIAICNVCGSQFLIPLGEEKHILHATLLGLAISLILNFLLIPYLGFIGAAITCVAAESVVCIYIALAAIKRIQLQIDYNLLKLIFASICLTGFSTVVFRSSFQGFWLIAVTATMYVISFVCLQIIVFKNAFIFSMVNIKPINA